MSSLFQVTGQLINIFVSPKGKNEEGQEYGGDHKIQILGDIAMKNGEFRKEMVTLKAPSPDDLGNLAIGDTISAPLGVFAQGGNITYFIPKGSTIASVGV